MNENCEFIERKFNIFKARKIYYLKSGKIVNNCNPCQLCVKIKQNKSKKKVKGILKPKKKEKAKIGAEKSVQIQQQQQMKIGTKTTKSEGKSPVKLDSRNSSKLAANAITYANVLTTGYTATHTQLAQGNPIAKTNQNEMINGIGYIVANALEQAQAEDRLVVGLSQAVKTLSNEPEDTMFCVLAQPRPGDSATHMQLILLQAYCYENGIYTIKVDDPEKLSRLVDSNKLESCVLIQRYKNEPVPTATPTLNADSQKLKLRIDLEDRLADHCEEYWDAQHLPVIRLPDE